MDFSWLSPPFFSPPPLLSLYTTKNCPPLLYVWNTCDGITFKIIQGVSKVIKYLQMCIYVCAKFFGGKCICTYWKKVGANFKLSRHPPFSPPPPLSTGMISFRPQFTTFSLTALSRTYNKTEKKKKFPRNTTDTSLQLRLFKKKTMLAFF